MEPKNTNKKKPTLLIAGLLGLVITGVVFHLLKYKEMHSSALFYIAVPVLLAYVFIRTATNNSFNLAFKP